MSDLSTLEDVSLRITAEDQKFERLELEIDVLREMFKYNKYKQVCCT
jgi:threonyl-tRNA synthetase